MLLRKLELWQTAVSYSRKFNLGVGNREKADTGSTAAAADSGYSRKLVTERRRILVVPVPPRRQTAVTAVNITWELVTESRRTLVVPPALLRQAAETGTAAPPVM
jgi:hypothetical protein